MGSEPAKSYCVLRGGNPESNIPLQPACPVMCFDLMIDEFFATSFDQSVL